MGKKDNKYSNAATSLSEGGIFGLGRPIDFTDGITRIALICTILTSVAATFWKTMGGADTETAMYFGLNTAAAFFFSWLIAQELDPRFDCRKGLWFKSRNDERLDADYGSGTGAR